MDASYGDERSNLAASHVFTQFAFGHLVNFQKRIVYNYLLRDFQVASVEWLTGPPLVLFGFVYGLIHWIEAAQTGIATPAGTIMLAALPIILGLQLSLSALGYDIANQPTVPIHVFLDDGSGPQGQRVADARDTAELEPDF